MTAQENDMTVQEYADKHGVSPRTVYRWIEEGQVNAKKVDNTWVVSQDEDAKIYSPHRDSLWSFAQPTDNKNTTLHQIFSQYLTFKKTEETKYFIKKNNLNTIPNNLDSEERSMLKEKLKKIDSSNLTLIREETITPLHYISYELEDEILNRRDEDETEEMVCKREGLDLRWIINVRFGAGKEIQWFREDGTPIATRTITEKKFEPVRFGYLPRLTERDSFIVNGIERVPIAQILPARGVIFERREDSETLLPEITAIVHPQYGKRLEFFLRGKDDVQQGFLRVSFDGAGITFTLKEFLETILKGQGIDWDTFKKYFKKFPDFESYAIARTAKKEKNLTTLEKQKEEERKKDVQKLQAELANFFMKEDEYYLSDRGRKRLNEKLKPAFDDLKGVYQTPLDKMALTIYDFTAIVYYLFSLLEGNDSRYKDDDFLHLKNREILLAGDHFEKIAHRYVVRIAARIKDKLNRVKSVNESFIEGLKDCLAGAFDQFLKKSNLCEILDSTNPLAEIGQKRKLTHLGEGGYKSAEHISLDKRDVHSSHYGRICPLETPESQGIGLKLHFATYSKVEEGQIVTPLKNQDSKKIEYLNAEEDESKLIAPAGESDYGRFGEEELVKINDRKVDYRDAKPAQFLGLSAMQIPFLQHNDATRCFMSSKNMKQAVPLEHAQQPFVKTGFEAIVGKLSGRAIFAKSAGKIIRIEEATDEAEKLLYPNGKVIVLRKNDGEEERYLLHPLSPTISHTYLWHYPRVKVGDKVSPGDLLADGAGMIDGELATGFNALVAYMPWKGYNFEDAVVISQRLVDVLTSTHVQEIKYKLEPGEVTYCLPDEAEELHLDDKGIIKVGTEVTPETIIIRKYRPYREGDKDKQLQIRGGGEYFSVPTDIKAKLSGIVIHAEKQIKRADKRGRTEIEIIKIWIQRTLRIREGDKLMGRHGNKGVIGKIVPTDQMPRLPDKTPIDILLNPHGVVSRMNIGQLMETHLGWIIKRKGEESRTIRAFETIKHDDIRKELAEIREKAENPEYELDENGKIRLIDSQGAQYEKPVVVGYQYILKLNHIAGEKIHARPQAKYALISQQPPAGKAQEGGLRMGEMEVWALLAHKAFDTLHELMTVKSDDLEGRKRLASFDFTEKTPSDLSQLLSGGKLPEAFRAFLMHLRGLAITPRFTLHSNFTLPEDLLTATAEELKSNLSISDELANLFIEERKKQGKSFKTIKDLQKIEGFSEEVQDKIREWVCAPPYDKIRSDAVKGLSLEISTDEEIRIGLPVTKANMKKKKERVVKLSCGCEGYSTDVLESENPLICKVHGELVKMPCCNEEGDYRKIVKIHGKKNTKKLFCKSCGAEVLPIGEPAQIEFSCGHREKISDFKKNKKRSCTKCGNQEVVKEIKPIKRLLSIVHERIGERYPKDSLFSEEIFGKEKSADRRNQMGYIPLASITTEKPLAYLDDIIAKKEAKPETSNLIQHKVREKHTYQVVVEHPLLKGISDKEFPQKRWLSAIPVIPVDLRPPVENGKYPLNTLYEKVIGQNNALQQKLKQMVGSKYSEKNLKYFEKNLKRLQEAVDALFVKSELAIKEKEASILQLLSGKDGLIRKHLAGKRVDFSGRAVIVPEPSINPTECMLPLSIAETLIGDLYRTRGENELQKLIDDKELYILLNRPPTLHKYNLLAFKPRLWDKEVIGLHPLTCGGFNADFDGDALGVIFPVTSHKEVSQRMTVENNLFSSANGNLMLSFSQDIVLGWYNKTLNGDVSEMEKILGIDIDEKKPIDKKRISQLLIETYRKKGLSVPELIEKAQKVMVKGFELATQSCVSFSIFDIPTITPGERQKLLSTIEEEGLEKYDRWKNQIKSMMKDKLEKEKENPISMLILSGARGNIETATQLGGLRGLMAKPGGGSYEQPIRSNFVEGLSPLEFFVSTHGSRKGAADKQLKTSEAGDLTRRMIEAGYTYDITEEDCGTDQGIVIETSIPDRIVGRVAAEDSLNIHKGEIITQKMAEDFKGTKLKVRSPLTCKAKKGICQMCYGIDLSKGIPYDVQQDTLKEKYLPEIGLKVGIIAAQSIGERGTQLTMRTFHTGGVKGVDITQGLPRVRNILENWRLPLQVYQIKGKVPKDVYHMPYRKKSSYPENELNEWEETLERLKKNNKSLDYEPLYRITKVGSSKFSLKEKVLKSELECELKALKTQQDNGKKVIFPEYVPVMHKVRPSRFYNDEEFDHFLRLYLMEMQKAYKDAINDKHFELVLQYIKTYEKTESGLRVSIGGITNAARNREGWIAQAAFQRANAVIAAAARNNKIDLFSDPKSKYLIGKRL